MSHARRSVSAAVAAASVAIALTLGAACDEPPPVATPAPTVGEQIRFAGTVSRSAVIAGSHRMAPQPQGVRFELENEPGRPYWYYVQSTDEATKSGVLRTEADGVARYYDLTGRHVEGTATLRTETARDVVTLQVRAKP